MKTLIAANWKMNPATQKEAKVLFAAVKKGVKNATSEVLICPPFVYLEELKGLPLGAQDVFFEEKGAFTGEISPMMLKDLGVDYVICGHSERRKMGETNELINKKIKKSLEAGLKIIFCIGENATEREENKKNEVLEKQIMEGLAGIADIKNITIAYEPVWAIGTGNNCSVEETRESINFIRTLAAQNRIIYGGSVNAENAAAYITEAKTNGLLVGGASLQAEEFINIVKSCE